MYRIIDNDDPLSKIIYPFKLEHKNNNVSVLINKPQFENNYNPTIKILNDLIQNFHLNIFRDESFVNNIENVTLPPQHTATLIKQLKFNPLYTDLNITNEIIVLNKYLNDHRIGLYLKVNNGKLQIQLQHSKDGDIENDFFKNDNNTFNTFEELKNWWNVIDDYTIFYNQPYKTNSYYGFGYKKLYPNQLEIFKKQYDYLINHHGHYHNHTTQTGTPNNNGTQIIWREADKSWPHIHAIDGLDPWYKPFEAQNSPVPAQNNNE